MANKTVPYYEQNYPATQYEYNMRGYRNERPCSDDTRRIKMQYNEGGTPSANYSYYDKVQGDQFPTCRGEQWSYQTYSVQKPVKCNMQGSAKKSSQPAVNTPRYYRNMAHRRPSALCLPVLAQPEPTVRRKSKSQSRFDGTENQDQKNTRYRPKQPRHPLLPPPPTMPHSTMPGTDQTDFDTSSGDGRRSLRSHSHSSGSLSVDISRQMESLNESFNAVAKERKGKKIIYGDVEPVYSQFDPGHGKPRKLHRRYSKKPKPVNEQTQNWGMQLWDLPEEHQIGEDCWSDKVEPEWINEEQRFNSIPNMIDNSQKKVHANRNHQRHTHTRNHLVAGPRAPSTHHLNPNRSTARPQGGLKESQEPQTAPAKQNSEEKDKVGYFENLFSEVFAQGCVDNMSKKTRLDFIKDAYDKYSASYDASGKQSENAANTDNFSTNEVQENNWTNNEYECHDNTQLNRFLPAYKNSPPVNESVKESKSKGNVPPINTPDDLSKVYQAIRVNKPGNVSNSVTEQNVTNFLLNVKPRRRSIKINETESGLPDKVVPRYPNLIEHMSSRFAGTISGSKIQLTSSPKADNSQNSNNSPFTSNNPSTGAPNKDYKAPGVNSQTVNNDRRTLSNLQTSTAAVQNQKSVGPTYHNKEIRPHGPGSSMTNQNNLHELNTSSNSSYQEQRDDIKYSDQNNPDYQDLDKRYKGHSNFANYSRAEDKGRINDTTVVYNNQEDYSSNMESNYLTIKKCQEILNQVRENFGEDLKENPEVFEVGGQYDDIGISESIERITYPTSNPPGLESSNVYNDNKSERHLLSIGMDSPYAQSENEMHCSPYDYYEKLHCQERIASINSRLNNSKSDEYNTNTIDEQGKIQTFQKDFYQQDESNNPQTFNEFDSSLNHCMASNEGPKNKNENMTPDQQASNYSAVNQDKVKQFIHSLTGFDVKHQDTNTRHRGNAEYESNCSKMQSEQGNTPATYSPVNSPNTSATDNYFRADNHSQSHYHQQFQQHQQQPKSAGTETANVDKRRLYSLPQRQEIERMQQDSMNGHSVSQTRDQQSQINYGDFLNEVPNRTPSTSQEYKSLANDPSNLKKLCDAYNNVNFDDENENVNQGDITDERYCVNFSDDNHNVAYPYGQNFSKFSKEELENISHDNKHVYYTGVSSTPSLMDATQKNNNSSDKGEFNYSLEQNYSEQREGCNQELCCYNVAESNQQYHPNSNSSNCENSENNDADDNNNYTPSIHCLINNEVDSTDYDNEDQNCEAEYSQNNPNENAILKRKYYYMPSDENEANIMANVNSDNQSCYKSYIENLIDNSLQNSEGDQARPVQGASQGSILQGQNDVVELETDKAIDLVMNESSHQMDSKLCLEITQRLTDTLVQSHKDIPTPCLVALEEPVYLQQLKKLRWDHLRHIEREVKRLESLERFLDTCGCGHMMYTKNAC